MIGVLPQNCSESHQQRKTLLALRDMVILGQRFEDLMPTALETQQRVEPATDALAALAMPALEVVSSAVLAPTLSALSSGPDMAAARLDFLHIEQQNKAFAEFGFDFRNCFEAMKLAA